jgi:MoaA/NifB/PqqE/SkfB family radical SAM enzyme
MTNFVGGLKMAKAVFSTPRIIFARPSVNRFLLNYIKKFKVKDVGGKYVLHSHLPPINSRAYSRFVKEHLLSKHIGPSHAQIGVTNDCPQNCSYCYNKNRTGTVMDTETIKRVLQELKSLGVFWVGITGGEPLLNKNLANIIESIGDDCAVKLFTTGSTLTPQLAADLKNAGLFSVAVSLDHRQEAEHDRVRNYPGAYRTALEAVETFKQVGGIHVSVSAVLGKAMLKPEIVEGYLQFLQGLGIHEAWLSETKPSVAAYWNQDAVISQDERAMLMDLQDRYNQNEGMTVNYLGHFEDAQHFGCSAGHKMIYIDAFGEVSPCVFVPMTFGNVKEKPVAEIYREMRSLFPTEDCCFINKNFQLFQNAARAPASVSKENSLNIMKKVSFGPRPKFFQLNYRGR